MRRARRCALLFAIAAAALAGAGLALESADIEIARVEGGEWLANGITATLTMRERGAGVSLRIEELALKRIARTLRDVRVDCPQLASRAGEHVCANAVARFIDPTLGAQRVAADVRYAPGTGAVAVTLAGLRIGEGEARIEAKLIGSRWSVSAEVERAPLEAVIRLASELGFVAPVRLDAGRATLGLSADGESGAVRTARAKGRIDDLALSNDAGSVATDGLSLDFELDVAQAPQSLRFALDVTASSGQAYAEPIFLDFAAHALSLSAEGSYGEASEVSLERFVIEHTGVARAWGRAHFNATHAQPLRALDVRLERLEFPGAYASYLQPFLLDTSFSSMQTSGALSGRVRIEDGAPTALDFVFEDLALDDGARTLALADLNGRWVWRAGERADESADDAGAASHIEWSGGALLGLELGPARLDFSSRGRDFRLLEPTTIPVFDGAVGLERFRVRGAGAPDVAFLIDATIQPISVELLCDAFGWPRFGGKVSGELSGLRMQEGVVTLGAALDAHVFDGVVRISGLELHDPFGQWPRLRASIGVEKLDLELLTGAFEFGRITGRLSGVIDDLELFNWTPVAFDARLYTPPDDRSRRRISQRAVKNIGSIGGSGAGVAAALSSGFLRFFDDFNYERLGVSCRLENEVCVMGGVGPAPNGGYYLVKGRGAPRIDVIGNAERVDWSRLVQQLIAVTKSGGPLVQ